MFDRNKMSITPDGEIIYRRVAPNSQIPLMDLAGIPAPPRPKKTTKRDEQDIIGIGKFYKMIPDEEAAVAFAEKRIWGDTPWCPRCGDDNVYRVKNGRPMSHRCRDCKRHFSVRTGTIMAETNLPIHTWLLAIHLMHSARKGISSIQLAKELDVTQKTAWFLEHRIREAMAEGNALADGEIIQVDEAYIGGKERWKHAKKKLHERWPEGKIAVIGFKEDGIGGKVRAYPIGWPSAEDVEIAVLDSINFGSTVYTDGHAGYRRLEGFGFEHGVVEHTSGQYVNGMATTNGIESFWALLKRGYVGTFHYMSWKHLHRYVDEFAARHNNGPGNGPEAIGAVLEQSVGKRLTRKRLIGQAD